jgi:hypothetical protein
MRIRPRTSDARRLTVTLVSAVGAAAMLAPAAGAATGVGTSVAATFTPSAQLTITASPVALGTVGLSSGPVSLSPVVITDTEADSTNWSASVAASDCFPPASVPSTLNVASATVPATALTFDAGSGSLAPTTSLTTGTPASATLGGSHAFTAAPAGGSLATPTFGTPLTVASTSVGTFTDPLSNDGTYTVNPHLSLNLSGTTAAPYAYTCTLQYTITG